MVRGLAAALAACLCVFGAESEFQPSAPYYATFFYPWYPQWTDQGHKTPENWFSNYLPDPKPCVFDPAAELYSSTDDGTIYWQLRKMAEARIEVAIASWWGRNHKTDAAMARIFDAMDRPDNPYPNLRWALYYERESLGDPSVAELVSDLNYVKERFAGRRSYLRIGGRPVIFVYADGQDGSAMAARWGEARAQTGFYVALKVYKGYAADRDQVDSWHQYAPAARVDKQSPWSWMVSPGFWKDAEDVRLPRDLDAFRRAVSDLVAAPVTWKLIETWNEWGEGTGVEPAEAVIQTTAGAAVPDPAGAPFKNLYVELLGEVLPPLEQGTGAAEAGPRLARVVNAATGAAGAVAPGEIVTAMGERLGGELAVSCAPATVLYAAPEQINAVVPDQPGAWAAFTAGESTVTLPVAAAAPGIFASILNADGTVNARGEPGGAGIERDAVCDGNGAGLAAGAVCWRAASGHCRCGSRTRAAVHYGHRSGRGGAGRGRGRGAEGGRCREPRGPGAGGEITLHRRNFRRERPTFFQRRDAEAQRSQRKRTRSAECASPSGVPGDSAADGRGLPSRVQGLPGNSS